MKRVALVTVLLASAGLFAPGGCSGPTPPGDAGFFPPPETWTPGSTTGTGGSPGTGGSFGAGGGTGAREDGGRRDRRQDAATLAPCPAGTMDGATCAVGTPTCALSTRDGGGRADLCTCRDRRGEATWRCEEP